MELIGIVNRKIDKGSKVASNDLVGNPQGLMALAGEILEPGDLVGLSNMDGLVWKWQNESTPKEG